MNNDRRKTLTAHIVAVEALSKRAEEIKGLLDQLKEDASDLANDIDETKGEEDEYRDAMPESLQSSDKYYTSEAASEQMNTAMERLREIDDIDLSAFDLDEIITALDEAKA